MDNTTVKTSPREFFLYAFAAGSLYFCAVTLVTLLWQLINQWLPLPSGAADYYYAEGISAALRWSIALLVVIFPAYVVAMHWIGRDVDRYPSRDQVWVRRWFLYATLFLSAVTLLGDLVYLVYQLLGGDVTSRFVLKALSVGLVAGAVFAYHWFLLRRTPGTAQKARKVITVVASVAVAVAVVAGFAVAGSPSEARALRNDATRIAHLEDIRWRTVSFWELKGRLPQSVGELVDPANPVPLPVDPVTGMDYGYGVTGERSFSICANFERESQAGEPSTRLDPYATSETWSHGAGDACFERVIDPDLYPVKPRPEAL